MNYCKKCGAQLEQDILYCTTCGSRTDAAKNEKAVAATAQKGQSKRSKLVAGLLGIFVGGFGVHNFYLGKIALGILQIVVTMLTLGFGSIWGFIEGILILCDRINKDGDGKPLAP